MTTHRFIFQDSSTMSSLVDGSVNLVVTSPPYPMIEMWDGIMSSQNPDIAAALKTRPEEAFELMHMTLDKVWGECFRVLKDGGIMCVNVGDATRTFNGNFQLFNNHSRIVRSCTGLGFSNLPNIIWRKQTNAPNKFMGSGMLPCGAYVTLEHEWILVFRKKSKRSYKTEEEKLTRRHSAFFWEERNLWFSDLWDIKGVKQSLGRMASRERSAAFPLSIPYRLINMYSQQGDTVLDPFCGLGTTALAAMASQRSSVGYDIDPKMAALIENNILSMPLGDLNDLILGRLENHLRFERERSENGRPLGYYNETLACHVMTSQETHMSLHAVESIERTRGEDLEFSCEYSEKSISDGTFHLGGHFSDQITA